MIAARRSCKMDVLLPFALVAFALVALVVVFNYNLVEGVSSSAAYHHHHHHHHPVNSSSSSSSSRSRLRRRYLRSHRGQVIQQPQHHHHHQQQQANDDDDDDDDNANEVGSSTTTGSKFLDRLGMTRRRRKQPNGNNSGATRDTSSTSTTAPQSPAKRFSDEQQTCSLMSTQLIQLHWNYKTQQFFERVHDDYSAARSPPLPPWEEEEEENNNKNHDVDDHHAHHHHDFNPHDIVWVRECWCADHHNDHNDNHGRNNDHGLNSVRERKRNSYSSGSRSKNIQNDVDDPHRPKHYCLAEYDTCRVTFDRGGDDDESGSDSVTTEDDRTTKRTPPTTTKVSCYASEIHKYGYGNDGDNEDYTIVSTIQGLIMICGFWLLMVVILIFNTTSGHFCLAYIRRCSVVVWSSYLRSVFSCCRCCCDGCCWWWCSNTNKHYQRLDTTTTTSRSKHHHLHRVTINAGAGQDDDDDHHAPTSQSSESNDDQNHDSNVSDDDNSDPYPDLQLADAFDEGSDGNEDEREEERLDDNDSGGGSATPLRIPSEFGNATNFRQLLSDLYDMNSHDPNFVSSLWNSAVQETPRLFEILQGGRRRNESHQVHREESASSASSSSSSTSTSATVTSESTDEIDSHGHRASSTTTTPSISSRSSNFPIPPPHIRIGTHIHLKTKRYKEANKKNEHASDDENQDPICCSICLCDVEEGDIVGDLACGHLLHKECLKDWLVRQNKCPLCQQLGMGTPRTSFIVGTAFDIDTWSDIVESHQMP